MNHRNIVCIVAVFVSLSFYSHAENIQLKTENYPPFNMSDGNSRIIGISTEIVEELFSRSNVPYDLELLPWTRAYKMALEEPNHAVFSTTRTEEREPLFKWVGPIVENNWIFLKKAGNNIQVESLDDAKQYRVGGYYGDAVSVYLESQGFTMNYVNKDYLNARKIDRDRIDLWATGQYLGPYYAKENGITNLEEVMTFQKTVMSIAFNKNTNDALIDQLNNELKLMVEDGTVQQIRAKYK